MRWQTLWRWMLLSPLAAGCLVQLSCYHILQQSVITGTLQFFTGQAASSFQGLAPLGDLLLGLVTGQSLFGN